MLRFGFGLGLVTLLFSSHTKADEFYWFNKVSFLSDYYSRGISQTADNPSPQFLSILSHSSGVYGGIFASRVEFPDNDQADQEIDLFFGAAKNHENWNFRAGLISYMYPNADSELNYNFIEFDLAVGYTFKWLHTEASLLFSPNYFGGSGKSRYTKLQATLPINEKLQLNSHIAHRAIETNALFGLPDNFDWKIGAEYEFIDNTSLTIDYVDSSFDRTTECKKVCDERLILGIHYTF